MPYDKNESGRRIRAAIDASPKSYADVSRETGISESNLQRLMAGGNPGAERLYVLADALGVTVDSLLCREALARGGRQSSGQPELPFRAMKIARAWADLPEHDQDAVEAQVRFLLNRAKKDTPQDTHVETDSRHTVRTDRRKARG